MLTKLNFSMNLPDEARERDIALSRELAARYDAHFVLGEKNIPHITVYAVEFPDDATSKVLEVVAGIIAEAQPLLCAVKRIESHQGYIGVEIARTDAIMRFHERVVHALSPLREQKHGGGRDYGMAFTDMQIVNMERYGYADAMQLYIPHFTITRLKDEKMADEAAKHIPWDIHEFIVSSFGLYVMGDHGTCKTLLREYTIGQAAT